MQRNRFGQLFSPRLFVPVTAALLTAAPFSIAQQQGSSPSSNQDVPSQTPGTNNPDVAKQRRPDQGAAPGSTSPKDPSQNNPAVPHQAPGTDSPDVGKQRQPGSGTSTASSTGKSKKKAKRHKSTTPDGTTT